MTASTNARDGPQAAAPDEPHDAAEASADEREVEAGRVRLGLGSRQRAAWRLRSFFNPASQCPFAYLGAGPAEPCGWVIVGPMLGTVLPRLNMHAAKALSYCAWIDL
jgi:hypothetical protein